MVFDTPVSADTAYAWTLIIAALDIAILETAGSRGN
jgi:hypothetical protein